jgi:hypothetical protein
MDFKNLPGTRYPLDQKPEPDGLGIYFIFLKNGVPLGSFSTSQDMPIYIGKSESSIAARNHASYPTSSSSTLRRSLGAILRIADKNFPDQQVFPRNSRMRLSGKSLQRALQNYRFSDKSESFLRGWMIKNLEYGYEIVRTGVDEIRIRECGYIQEWNPILNLDYCSHPKKQELKELRKECREEAERCFDSNE